MIDDKKTDEAAREAADLYEQDLPIMSYNEDTEVDGQHHFCQEFGANLFKDGAKWAINEFLKNLWHPASEIPTKPNASILAKAIYDIEEDTPLKYPFYYITYTPPCDMFSKKPSEEWNKRSSIIGISDWLYVDDLFPKEGGEE